MRMPFGKYEGERLEDIPLDYLAWVLEHLTKIDPVLRRQIRQVLRQAQEDEEPEPPRAQPQPGPPVQWPEVIRTWYHGLARDYHPDRGGSVQAMQVFNEAHDRLLKLVGPS
jgi:hypothetical protein